MCMCMLPPMEWRSCHALLLRRTRAGAAAAAAGGDGGRLGAAEQAAEQAASCAWLEQRAATRRRQLWFEAGVAAGGSRGKANSCRRSSGRAGPGCFPWSRWRRHCQPGFGTCRSQTEQLVLPPVERVQAAWDHWCRCSCASCQPGGGRLAAPWACAVQQHPRSLALRPNSASSFLLHKTGGRVPPAA